MSKAQRLCLCQTSRKHPLTRPLHFYILDKWEIRDKLETHDFSMRDLPIRSPDKSPNKKLIQEERRYIKNLGVN